VTCAVPARWGSSTTWMPAVSVSCHSASRSCARGNTSGGLPSRRSYQSSAGTKSATGSTASRLVITRTNLRTVRDQRQSQYRAVRPVQFRARYGPRGGPPHQPGRAPGPGRRDLPADPGAILEGRLRSGDPLPPSRELARRLSVSRTTVMVAYDRLIGEGFVAARSGRAPSWPTTSRPRRGVPPPPRARWRHSRCGPASRC
jgi:hypothetical protein